MNKGLCLENIDVNKLNKNQLIKKIQTYRRRWEKITKRDQESDVDLSVYTVKQLRESLKYFSSDECKFNAKSLKLDKEKEKKKGIFNIFFSNYGIRKLNNKKSRKKIKYIRKSKKKNFSK